VRVARTVHERLTRANAVAFLNVHVHTARQRVLTRLAAFVRHHQNFAGALDDAAVTHDAIDFRDDGRFARLAGFEQLDHARQTARDVLGLGRFARDLRQNVAVVHRLTVRDHQMGVRRHVVLVHHMTFLVEDLDRRLLLLIRRIDDDQSRETRDFVHVFVDRHLVDDVLEADRAARLGQDREGVRIPLDEHLGLFNLLVVLDLEVRAVDDRVPLADHALVVDDVDRTAAVHHDHRLDAVLLAAFDVLQAVELDGALVTRFERRLILDA